MADLPSQLPRWADTVEEEATEVTEPTEEQKDVGWDTTYLFRQYLNWLFVLIYRWIAWLSQVVFRWSDFGPDQALPGGTAPTADTGLTIDANSFSATVIAGGYRLGPITGPNSDPD